MTTETNFATPSTGQNDMGFFPYGTARDRVLLERGHRVWLEGGTFACQAGRGLPYIPETDWAAADEALAAENTLIRKRELEAYLKGEGATGTWPVYPSLCR